MSRASGSWTVTIDGQPHQVTAEWDLHGTGGGRISVDGEPAEQSSFGTKWPGAQRSFVVAGRRFAIAKRGLSDAELDLYANEPGLGWPVVPAAPKGPVVLVVVLVALALAGIAVGVLVQ